MPWVSIGGAVSRGHASESKSHGFESHSCHLMWAYGPRFVQVRPVRYQISHLKKFKMSTALSSSRSIKFWSFDYSDIMAISPIRDTKENTHGLSAADSLIRTNKD